MLYSGNPSWLWLSSLSPGGVRFRDFFFVRQSAQTRLHEKTFKMPSHSQLNNGQAVDWRNAQNAGERS